MDMVEGLLTANGQTDKRWDVDEWVAAAVPDAVADADVAAGGALRTGDRADRIAWLNC